MESTSLIAYIPVLNQRHLDWFEKYKGGVLELVSQRLAEEIEPKQSRNIGAIPTVTQLVCISSLRLFREVTVFEPQSLLVPADYILPDDDICHSLVDKFKDRFTKVTFENIKARYDMSAVKQTQPVIPDCEVSTKEIDILRIAEADKFARKSPDWWRQVGAMAFRGDQLLACGFNEHLPTEYETDIFGDPRINFNAGDPAGIGIYLSLHAEESLICFCADNGIQLRGASMYINTFPCANCARAVAKSGIKELFFREGSSFLSGFEILKNAGVRIVQVR